MRYFAEKCSFVKVDFSFVFIFVLAIFLEEVWLYFMFVVFGLLHELAHYFVAKKLGYLAKNIRLNFFGASLEGCDDFALSDEIKIILAGPLFNLFVVILCYLSFWFYPESYNFLYEVLIANWSLFLFNFLPVFPLDLGRILLAVFSIKLKRIDAIKRVRKLSLIFIILLFGLFLTSFFFEFNFSLGFVAVNLASLLFSSSEDTSYKRSMFAEKKLKLLRKGLIERKIYVEDGTPYFKLFKFIDDYHFLSFVFVDSDMREVEILSETDFYKLQGLM